MVMTIACLSSQLMQGAAAVSPMRASVSVLDQVALHPEGYAKVFFGEKGYAAWEGSIFNDFEMLNFTTNQATAMTYLSTKVYALIKHIIALHKEILSLREEVNELKAGAQAQSAVDAALAASLLVP